MPLTGADAFTVSAELETPLGVGVHDVLQLIACDGAPGLGTTTQQLVHVRPACGVEGDVCRLRLMTKHQTEKFAGAGGLVGGHFNFLNREVHEI